MKIALVQINTASSDLEGNFRKIQRVLQKAAAQHPDLIIFPEMALLGYPPKDFLFQHGFLDQAQQTLRELARQFSTQNILIGSVEHRFNVAYFLSKGKVELCCKKTLLPSYDVFDEKRYFDSGSGIGAIELLGKRIAVSICEDVWARQIPEYRYDPIDELKKGTFEMLINLSASPFHPEQDRIRKKIMGELSKQFSIPSLYVNLVGGNDELIFDGGSFWTNDQGQVAAQASFFKEQVLMLDVDQPSPYELTSEAEPLCTLGDALTLGLYDFVRKCGFEKVVLGLSGGIDSALVLLLCLEAFGKDRVQPVFLPSKYTSSMSKEDVRHMSDCLGMQMMVLPIDPIVEVSQSQIQALFSSPLRQLTIENLQARVRGNLLMSIAAEKNALVIGTGNKSELATGYSTLYGDLIGAVLPIGDLYKHQVYALARHLNQKYKAIPDRVFDRPPSAELSENQKDSDRLPEYPTLDPIVKAYVEDQASLEEMIEQGLPRDKTQFAVSLIQQSEFKRKQAPPILRVSPKAFGVGRRMPIASKAYDS